MDKDYLDISNTFDVDNLTPEETKALGGDIKFTHLVKGLDEKLADKIKAEIEEEKKKLNIVNNGVNCELAKNIINLINNKPKIDNFIGRCKYSYDLKCSNDNELYSIVMKSKKDCPNPNSFSFVDVNNELINTISDSLSVCNHII